MGAVAVMRLSQRFVSLFVVTVLMAATLSCRLIGKDARRVTREKHYLISSTSILQSLAEGNQDLFIPIDTEPEKLPSPQEWITWHQSDFLQVAEAVHQQVWGESSDAWKINFESFGIPCNQVGEGFWSASFSYFKEVRTLEGLSQIERQIDIYPTWEFINVWEFTYEPSLLGVPWNSIEKNKIEISADGALMIAEQNGGAEERIAVQDACDISVNLSPNSVNYHGWHIMYSPSIYSISIDPTTGEVVAHR
jgi:hypothetical protein